MTKLKQFFTKYKNHMGIAINILFLIALTFSIFDYIKYESLPTNITLFCFALLLFMYTISGMINEYLEILNGRLETKKKELDEDLTIDDEKWYSKYIKFVENIESEEERDDYLEKLNHKDDYESFEIMNDKPTYEDLESHIENLEYQVECLSRQVDKYQPKVECSKMSDEDIKKVFGRVNPITEEMRR